VLKIEDGLEKEGSTLQDVHELMRLFNKNGNTADLVTILRDRLILNYAKKNNYQFVLKGVNG
jgi:hypothetical protein